MIVETPASVVYPLSFLFAIGHFRVQYINQTLLDENMNNLKIVQVINLNNHRPFICFCKCDSLKVIKERVETITPNLLSTLAIGTTARMRKALAYIVPPMFRKYSLCQALRQ